MRSNLIAQSGEATHGVGAAGREDEGGKVFYAPFGVFLCFLGFFGKLWYGFGGNGW